jgi:hypothetical protein
MKEFAGIKEKYQGEDKQHSFDVEHFFLGINQIFSRHFPQPITSPPNGSNF